MLTKKKFKKKKIKNNTNNKKKSVKRKRKKKENNKKPFPIDDIINNEDMLEEIDNVISLIKPEIAAKLLTKKLVEEVINMKDYESKYDCSLYSEIKDDEEYYNSFEYLEKGVPSIYF